MKKPIIILLIVGGIYVHATWKPSPMKIAENMEVGELIRYEGKEYESDWGEEREKIEGYLRQKDRHYQRSIPIVTYDLIVTSGEFSDPDIVKIKNKGNGNYYWHAKKQPEGTLVVYHSVPSSLEAQYELDRIEEGADVNLIGKISQDGKISSESGDYLKLRHDNHKFILVEEALEK